MLKLGGPNPRNQNLKKKKREKTSYSTTTKRSLKNFESTIGGSKSTVRIDTRCTTRGTFSSMQLYVLCFGVLRSSLSESSVDVTL